MFLKNWEWTVSSCRKLFDTMFLSEVGSVKPDKVAFFEIMRGRASFVVVFFHDMMCRQQGIVGSVAYGFKMLRKSALAGLRGSGMTCGSPFQG